MQSDRVASNNYHDIFSIALSFGSSEVLKQLTIDGHSKSDEIQKFMGINFHHRQGQLF